MSKLKLLLIASTLTAFTTPLLCHGDANTDSSFNFKALVNLMDSNQVQSIDELIPKLPDSYKKNFVLMLKSGSLQRATQNSPRVIAYGSHDKLAFYETTPNSDRLLIAYQTDTTADAPPPHLPNSLEVIEWVPEKSSYQFYDVSFQAGKRTITTNPETCNACHGTPLRPNWTGYPMWDGAIGNNNGLTGDYKVDPFAATPEQAQSLFDRLKTLNPRLQALDFGQYFAQNLEYPNAYMSEKIGAQMQKRNTQLLRNWNGFKKFKYAIAGAFTECRNSDDFFEPALLSSLKQNVINNLSNTPSLGLPTPKISELSFLKLFSMTAPLVERSGVHLGHQYADEVQIAAWLRLIFEGQGRADLLKNLLGSAPAATSSMNWAYDFVGFGERMTGLRDAYLRDTTADYPDLFLLAGTVTEIGEPMAVSSMTDDTCVTLAKLSRKATHGMAVPIVTVPVVSNPQAKVLGLFQQFCSSCHTSGARPLGLSDLDALKNYRTSKQRTIRDRLLNHEMPPAVVPQPSEGDRTEMINALAP